VSMGPDGGTGYAEQAAVDATTIDAASIGRQASQTARVSANAVALDAGDYPVVLEEYAVVDLLDMLGYLGFSALAVQEERSFVEIGKRIGSELVTIVDDGRDPAGLPMAFDYEGVAKQRVPLLEAGVCRGVVHDAQTAARDGVTSTGHGLPAPNSYGPFPLNNLMAAGDTPRADLIAGLDRGLLVTRFHYTNPVHPKLVIITGMTRDGTFLVEDGRIVAPVKNLRFTQSYLEALAGVVAVSSERRTVKGFLGGAVVPALRLEGWTFTGTTEH
jgi:PmbA protein